MMDRLVIAGAHSGVGKTTLTSGLIAECVRRGLSVQPFKVGPDYIDPSYHALAAGRPCRNLDSWMVPPERIPALFAHSAGDCDLAIVEGVMGLYDGAGYEDDAGSTAEVAKLIDAPVVLVLDAARMGRSAAAVALGYRQYDPSLRLAGYIVNRVGSERHGQGIAGTVERATGLPVFGWLPRDAALEIPERHLGLVPTAEPGRWHAFIEAAAERVRRYLDVERILEVTPSPPGPLSHFVGEGGKGNSPSPTSWARGPGGEGPLIAVARDAAFSFTYQDNLDLLRAAGAEIAFFSPLRDANLPPGAAAIVLSGGFPEMFAEPLAANRAMQDAVRDAHRRGTPIYAECGGLMYLTEWIADLGGRRRRMVGLLPGHSLMGPRVTLGYRLAQAAGDSWLLDAGETVRGHEFHYSIWEDRPADLPAAYRLLPRDGQGEPRPDGACLGNLWASYVHLHFWGKPEIVDRFAALGGSLT